jgi:hypothetical protein
MVKIYVEGGGDAASLKSKCRDGFREFLTKAGIEDKMFSVVACGGRTKAFDMFCTAIQSGTNAYLLVDSEEAVDDAFQKDKDQTKWKPWGHLEHRKGDGWQKPQKATDTNCHLMVQCMENWFLADSAALKNVFTKGFKERKLPVNKQIETIGKTEAYDALEAATKDCNAGYSKGGNSFKILAEIDPAKVTSASPWAKRFVDTLKTATST